MIYQALPTNTTLTYRAYPVLFALVSLAFIPGASFDLKWIFLYLAGPILLGLSLSERPVHFPKPLFIGFTIILIYTAVRSYHDWNSILIEPLLSRSVFFLYIIFFFNLAQPLNTILKAIAKVYIFTTIICILFTSVIILLTFCYLGTIDHYTFASTFENPNFMAQFLALSIFFQTYYLYEKQVKHPKLLIFLISISLAWLIILNGRSALLSLLIAASFSTVFLFKKKYLFLLSSTCFITLFFALSNIKTSYFTNFKTNLFSSRLELWSATLELIKTKPLGAGLGKFQFEIIPFLNSGAERFSGKKLYLSPHNEIFRIIAEEGLPIGIIFLIITSFLLFKGFKLTFTTKSKEWTLISTLFLFFFTEGLFQFPLQTPLTFLMIAFLLGRTFQALYKTNYNIDRVQFLKVISIVFLLQALLFTISKSIEIAPRKEKLTSNIGCITFPSNWTNCLDYATLEMYTSNFKDSTSTLNQLLKTNPNNSFALRSMAQLKLLQTDFENHCFYLKKYFTLVKKEGEQFNNYQLKCN